MNKHGGRVYSSCPNCLKAELLTSGSGSERNHKETWAGSIVSLTIPTTSSLRASRSVSSLSLAEKGLPRVVLTAVEAPIYETLYVPS